MSWEKILIPRQRETAILVSRAFDAARAQKKKDKLLDEGTRIRNKREREIRTNGDRK